MFMAREVKAEEVDNMFLLSVKDFEKRNIKINPNWTGLEALMVVADVASEKLLEEQEFMEKKKKKKSKDPAPDCVSNQQRLMKEIKTREKPVAAEKKIGSRKRSFLEMEKNNDEEWGFMEFKHGNGRSKNPKKSEKNPRRQKTHNQTDTETVQDMPESMRNIIEGMDGKKITLVIQKTLYVTDMSDHHGRMSVPLNQIKSDFLNEQEEEYLKRDGGQMKVLFIEPSRTVSTMNFNRWKMEKNEGKKSSYSYILQTYWNDVKSANGLKAGDKVQLWSFRVSEQLCLALVKVTGTGGEDHGTLQVKPHDQQL
ncbi:hypothetical protein JRO89_XS10G0062600 [Xanthoceras sorbifolium]|uniref:B3 domain-containing protein n=1 Tax=Xanthoceras sorbifolium TaxID=99658 RepID=A0ABQ8HI16_9ROSI|nr:hypothetical protein JRO89_XS10G0062600 [Xanthoceras sorbifolium]